MRLILVGAGECAQEILAAAAAKGIRVSYGYGLTETSSGVAISVRGNPSAMEICPDDEILIAEDGEICIKAPTCVMEGYYKDSALTEQVLRDGILYTGDLGYLDEEGNLHITGRKKEILVMADGTKIFLPEYETKIAHAARLREIAAVLKEGKPVLIVHAPDRKREEIAVRLEPLMKTLPRGHQLTEIIMRETPLPRTATGKIKRWELQKETESE
jgi:long-subunit acyl-CoA synthetase (AMP-forming)